MEERRRRRSTDLCDKKWCQLGIYSGLLVSLIALTVVVHWKKSKRTLKLKWYGVRSFKTTAAKLWNNFQIAYGKLKASRALGAGCRPISFQNPYLSLSVSLALSLSHTHTLSLSPPSSPSFSLPPSLALSLFPFPFMLSVTRKFFNSGVN